MYKIQNTTAGNLPVDLEQGSIILRPGQMFDLEDHCSRKWIMANPTLKHLVKVGAIRIAHDSDVVVPKAPVKPATRKLAPPKKKKEEKPIVVDLSKEADPTPEKYKKPAVKKPKKTKKTVKKDPVEEAVTSSKKSSKKKRKSSSRRSWSHYSDDD